MTNPDERLDRVEDRLEMMERLLAETIQIVQSNAKSNQALADTVADTNRQLAAQIADTNRQLADTNHQLNEHITRTTAAIEELSAIVGSMARVFNEHINDNDRHN